MKNLRYTLLFSLMIIVFSTLLICCSKKEVNTPPVVITNAVISSDITKTSTHIVGVMTSNGGIQITTRGFCLSKKPTPSLTDTIITDSDVSHYNSADGKFQCDVASLAPKTKYYIKAFATNTAGTGYGNVESFTSPDYIISFNTNLTYGTLTDVDGNKYKTIQIGTQTWMAENLKVNHYRDGSVIPIAPVTDWRTLVTGAYCDYLNLPLNSDLFGKIYNGYAMSDAIKIAPIGWHVATYSDWITLFSNYGGISFAGGKLKEVGLNNWQAPNIAATNESGFTALPLVGIYHGGFYGGAKAFALWWSDIDSQHSIQEVILGNDNIIMSVIPTTAENGYAIRCVKDN